MKRQIVLMIALICAACQVTSTPVVVEATIEAPIIPTATPDCQHAEGVRLEIHRISDSGVELQASGLQPGEIPYATFDTFLPSGTGFRIESGRFVAGADGNGNFSFEQGLSRLPEGETSATWDIRFIHARGVECATITLP